MGIRRMSLQEIRDLITDDMSAEDVEILLSFTMGEMERILGKKIESQTIEFKQNGD